MILFLYGPMTVMANSHPLTADSDLPSEAMLEFLADLEPIDEETWQLLEHHALRDLALNKEANRE